jgi:hypothetical protein
MGCDGLECVGGTAGIEFPTKHRGAIVDAVEVSVFVFIQSVVVFVELQVVVLIAFEKVIGFGGGTEDTVIAHVVDVDLFGFAGGVSHSGTVIDDIISNICPENLVVIIASHRGVSIAVVGEKIVVNRDVSVVNTGFEQSSHGVPFVSPRFVAIVAFTVPKTCLPEPLGDDAILDGHVFEFVSSREVFIDPPGSGYVVDHDPGTPQRQAVFCIAIAPLRTVGGFFISCAKTDMLNDEIVPAKDTAISTDHNPVAWGGLAGEGQFVVIELKGRVQFNMSGDIKDDGSRSGLGVRAIPERPVPGVVEVGDVTDIASTASGGIHSFALCSWKGRAFVVRTGSGRTSTKPLVTGKLRRANTGTGEGASASVIMVFTTMQELGCTCFWNAFAVLGRLTDTIIGLVAARRVTGKLGPLGIGNTNIVDVFPGRVARKPQLVA